MRKQHPSDRYRTLAEMTGIPQGRTYNLVVIIATPPPQPHTKAA